MSDRKEDLDKQIRETPLLDRLDKCRQIIGKLCSERRPPKMTIPVQAYDEDIFISVSIKDAIDEITRLRETVTEIKQVNPLRNDWDGYLFDLQEWGLGERETRPVRSDYGV